MYVCIPSQSKILSCLNFAPLMVLEYFLPVWHSSLTVAQMKAVISLQSRATNTVFQDSEYTMSMLGDGHGSVRRRGKNIDSSSKSNPLRRREKKLRRVDVKALASSSKKNEESRRTDNKNSCDLLTAITHTEILVAR